MGRRPTTIRLPAPGLRRVGDACRLEATIEGRRVWFESPDADLAPRPEAFVCSFVVPALARGHTLVVEGEVDPQFAANVPRLLDVMRSWWGGEGRVEFERLAPAGARALPVTALALSGGADSFHALRRGTVRPDVLVHVHGFDVALDDARRAAAAQRSFREVAAAVGARAVVVRTNVRAHPRFHEAHWEHTHGGALLAVGHALSTTIGRLLVAASWHEGLPCPHGTHPRTDPLFGGTHVAFASTGGALSRFDKIRELLDDPLVQRHLRVCYGREAPEGNCGRCEKCLRTRLVAEQAGRGDALPTLPRPEPIEAGFDRLPRASCWIHLAHVEVELGRGLAPSVAAAVRRFRARSRPPGAPARADHAWETPPPRPAAGPAPAPGPARWRVGTPRVEEGAEGRRVAVDVAGAPLWFASRDARLAASPEAFASALTVPALSQGVRLEVEPPVDRAFAAGSTALDSILRSWWGYEGPAVSVRAAEGTPSATRPGTAFAFGGGVTSFDALRRDLVRPDVLVWAHGLDVPLHDTALASAAEAAVRAVAAERGARAIVVRTNLREHPAFAGVPSVPAEGGVLAALGHLLVEEAGSLVVGSPQHAHYCAPHGIHPRTWPLLGATASALRIVGDDLWRGDKVAGLASYATARAHLRVCLAGRGATANCSRCVACLRTMTGLEAAGALGSFPTFDSGEPLAARIDRLGIVDDEWALSIEADLGRGLRPDTAQAVRDLLARGAPPRRPALVRALRRLRRHFR